MTDLPAQYKVFKITGTAEMSIDGETWTPLKKKDELKESYQIRLPENSVLDIIDSKNFVYSYENTKTVSVAEIVKQRKTIFEAMHGKMGKRSAIGGVERGKSSNSEKIVNLLFTDTEMLVMYDDWDLIPIGTTFYITIINRTGEDKIVDVYQKLENKELIPCFPEDILIEKNSIFEITELLFGKQDNNKFIVISKEK